MDKITQKKDSYISSFPKKKEKGKYIGISKKANKNTQEEAFIKYKSPITDNEYEVLSEYQKEG